MRRFVREKAGNTVILTAFLILLFFTLAVVVYSDSIGYCRDGLTIDSSWPGKQ